jgi:hypothetical protein
MRRLCLWSTAHGMGNLKDVKKNKGVKRSDFYSKIRIMNHFVLKKRIHERMEVRFLTQIQTQH